MLAKYSLKEAAIFVLSVTCSFCICIDCGMFDLSFSFPIALLEVPMCSLYYFFYFCLTYFCNCPSSKYFSICCTY